MFLSFVMHVLVCRLLGAWPNTYAYTKAIAEDTVRTLGKDLPVGVFRPSISKYYVL
jgi:fatty acyl-CoA reductase